MVQKLVQHDQTNHQYCPPTETFTADNDPDGSIESSRVDADTKFDFKCNNIIKTAWILYHELMAKTEKTKRIVLGDAIYEKAKTRNAAICNKMLAYKPVSDAFPKYVILMARDRCVSISC